MATGFKECSPSSPVMTPWNNLHGICYARVAEARPGQPPASQAEGKGQRPGPATPSQPSQRRGPASQSPRARHTKSSTANSPPRICDKMRMCSYFWAPKFTYFLYLFAYFWGRRHLSPEAAPYICSYMFHILLFCYIYLILLRSQTPLTSPAQPEAPK